MPYQFSNASSTSLADSWTSSSQASDNVSKSEIYKPIRGTTTRSRIRPALPPSFLQLGGMESVSTPWKKRDATTLSASDLEDDVFVTELSRTLKEVDPFSYSTKSKRAAGYSSSSGSAPDSPVTTPTDQMRFSTCFGSTTSLLAVENSEPCEKSAHVEEADIFVTPRKNKISGGLKPWKTPTTDSTPRAGSGRMRSASSSGSPRATRHVGATFRSIDTKAVPSPKMQENDILHIRLPSPRNVKHQASLGVTSPSSPRRPLRKAEAQAARAAKVAEKNLRIRAEDPKAKDVGTALDGLFGIGKEESKAMRGGYAGVGIAGGKKAWKITEDYQTLLHDNVRSSVYNYAYRSPKSPRSPRRRRKSSCPSSPPTPRSPRYSPQSTAQRPIKARKGPPPPLDLSKVSSFSTVGTTKHVSRRKPAGKGKVAIEKAEKVQLHPMEDEIAKRVEGTEVRLRRVTIRGILKSVKSLSNLRGQ